MTKPTDIAPGDEILVTIPVLVTDVIPVENGTTEIYISGPLAITVNNDADITRVEAP